MGAIRPQDRGQYPRIPQVRFGAGDPEPVPMALHRFRIDGIDGESLIEEGADERAVRSLERDQDIVPAFEPAPGRCS
jgi:hypothetical protein